MATETETWTPVGAAQALDGFDNFVEATLKDWTVPGSAVVVVKDGEVILSRGYGLRDVERGLEVTPRTIFAIGSATKAFTTMSLALLADEGKIDWDTPVRQYLPSFTLYDTFATERMTPRDLVTHRSGLPRHDLAWYNSPASRAELVGRLRYLQPNKDFRTVWQYQNLMYVTAGYLVEVVTGRPWEEFVKERIFTPLGMGRGNLSVDDSKRTDDYALPYKDEDGKPVEIPFRNIDTIGPAGSINSSVEDMARWLLLHLSDGSLGDKRVVSAGQLAQLHAPQMVMPEGAGLTTKYKEAPHASYGMGWFVQPYRGHDMIHHGGNIDGFSAMVAFLPAEQIGVVALSNRDGNPVPMILALDVFDRLLGLDRVPWNARHKEDDAEIKKAAERGKEKSASDRVEGKGPSHPLADYAGEYEHPGYGVLTVTVQEGDGKEDNSQQGAALTARYNNIDLALAHYHYDVFELVYDRFDLRLKAVFSTNARGDIDSLSVPLELTTPDIVFKRLPPKGLLDRAALEQLAGGYEIMGATLTVALKGEETLQVSMPGLPDYELVPYKGTQFELKGLSGFSLEFKRDASGAASEVVITQPGGVFTAKRR